MRVNIIGFQTNSNAALGDASADNLDLSCGVILPREDADRLVHSYFNLALPTYRLLHRPTFNVWFEEYYGTNGQMFDQKEGLNKIAVLYMVFALGRMALPGPADLRSVQGPPSSMISQDQFAKDDPRRGMSVV